MALPSGLNLKIELLFDYKSDTPKIRITDETNYAAEGRVASNIRGLIKLVNSEGAIAYQGTAFDAPDLDLSVSNVVIITPSNCGCDGHITWCDTFTLTYSIQDVSNSNEFEKSFTKYLCFTPFEAKIIQRLDCYTATLTSTDCTAYSQNSIVPTFTDYAHTLTSKNKTPLNFDVLQDDYSVSKSVSLVYPNLYSGLHESSVGVDLEYDLGDNWFIIYTVNACVSMDVECFLDLCKISCILYEKLERYEQMLCKNSIKAEASGMGMKLQFAFGKLALHQYLVRCGWEQKATKVIDGLLADLGIDKEDCGCGCGGGDCEPQKILPIRNDDLLVQPLVVVSAGVGVDVTLDQTTPNVNAYTVEVEGSEFDEFEYLSFPFTDNTLSIPFAFAAPFTSVVEIHAIDANFVTGLSYKENHGSIQNVTLPLAAPITISASAHIDWTVASVTGGTGSIVLKYKIV